MLRILFPVFPVVSCEVEGIRILGFTDLRVGVQMCSNTSSEPQGPAKL